MASQPVQRRLGIFIVVGVLTVVGARGQAIFAQPTDDPYSKTFADFEWDETDVSVPTPGAVRLDQEMPIEAVIAYFEQRVKAQPEDCMSLAFLGNLYFHKAKQDDDWSFYVRAAEVLERSLQSLPNYESAKIYLAEVYAAQHRFQDALKLVLEVLEEKPQAPMALAIKTDCQLELGQYDDAKQTLEALKVVVDSAPILARSARLAELTGDRPQAIELFDRAIKDLESFGAQPAQISWYQWRKGILLFASGQMDQSRMLFEAALKAQPEDAGALTGLTEALFAQGDSAGAIKQIERVIELYNAPPAMALLGDIYQATGKDELAQSWHDKAEAAMRQEQITAGDAHARELALFLANHNRHPAEAAKLARHDLQRRQDVFTSDTLAWCLYQNGEFSEAKDWIEKALEVGIQDASVYFHAARIFTALGDDKRAADFDKSVAKLNSHFSVLHSTAAASTSH